MFDKVKKALRITHDDLDDDIQMTISSAMADLKSAGIDSYGKSDDEMLILAVTNYCRYVYDQLGKGETWFKYYTDMKIQMALDSDYRSDSNV